MKEKKLATKPTRTSSSKSQKKPLKNSNRTKTSQDRSELINEGSVQKDTKRTKSTVRNEKNEIDFSKSFFLNDLLTSSDESSRETFSAEILKKIVNLKTNTRIETLNDGVNLRDSGKTPSRKHQVFFILAIFIIVILGFWAPQISRIVGIPIDPAAYTAEYFENPEIVKTGIVSGDLLNVRIENGFRKKRTISWKAINASRILDSGRLEIPSFGTSSISIKTTGALPGEKIQVYIDHVSKPLTVSVN
jgi:hypothetical protein